MSDTAKRMGRPRLEGGPTHVVSLNLTTELVTRLESQLSRLAGKHGWARPSRSAVGRLVLERGLAALEAESPAGAA